MSNFTILGTVEFVPGTRDQLLTALAAHRARSLQEPGTLEFEILIPSDKRNTTEVITELIASRITAFDMNTVIPSWHDSRSPE